MNHELKLSARDMKSLVTNVLEGIEEIRIEMPDPPESAVALVEELVDGPDFGFGDQYVAARTGLNAGIIEGIACALGCTPAQLVADLKCDPL